MSVSSELLCSFELLKPLDSSALKNHIKKGRNKRQSMLNSPVCPSLTFPLHLPSIAIAIYHAIYHAIYDRDLTANIYPKPASQHPQSV